MKTLFKKNLPSKSTGWPPVTMYCGPRTMHRVRDREINENPATMRGTHHGSATLLSRMERDGRLLLSVISSHRLRKVFFEFFGPRTCWSLKTLVQGETSVRIVPGVRAQQHADIICFLALRGLRTRDSESG